MFIDQLFLWSHILGVVAWIGGIAYVLFVLMPAVPKIALRDRANFIPIILRRFLALVWTSVAVILLSGTYRIFWVWNASQAEFWGSPVGRILMEKLTLVAVILVVVSLVTFRAVPRALTHVATHQKDAPDAYACQQCATVVGSLKRHLQVGLAVALLIIFWAVRLRS